MTSEAIEKVAKKIEAEIDSTQTDRNIICHVDYEFILCRKTCFYLKLSNLLSFSKQYNSGSIVQTQPEITASFTSSEQSSYSSLISLGSVTLMISG